MKPDLKSIAAYAGIVVLFAIASAVYFFPSLQGKVIYAGDSINAQAAVQEGKAYSESGGNTFWTGAMFSGMPNYQIGGGRTLSSGILRPIRKLTSLGPNVAFFIFFFYLIAFFALLRTFGVNKWLSVAGAFAIAMSSYFFVIIAAQHGGKTISITWMMPVVIGFYLTYRKRYLPGALLVMFFVPVGFFTHPQMSYYICMMIGILFFAELAIAAQGKVWKHFAVATLVFFGSFGIGMGIGSANIFTNQEYARETMRGGHSDLVKESDATNKTEGLDLDYATAWSEGIGESMTFLIPNYMGGASGYNLGKNSQLEKDLTKMGVQKRQAQQFCQHAPTYWGEKAFTSGPVYMGAIVIFLFVLALLIVDGPYKWALLVATLFSVALSWGRNFMWLTELFFTYFPMYNKFRAVESILIVAEITVPLLALLGLKAISERQLSWERVRRSLLISGGLTAGICALVALLSGSIDVSSSYDASWKGQVGEPIYNLILSQRQSLIRSDAWRSMLFVLLGCGVTYWYAYTLYKKEQGADGRRQGQRATVIAGLALTVLIVADMWAVDKRFCNDAMFTSKKEEQKAFAMLPYEKRILQDDSYYRVLNMSTNTFNEARTGYYLHSIGGYSAAKLRRYQDLIDEHISKEMNPLLQTVARTGGRLENDPNQGAAYPVLNMLNMKYTVVPTQGGQPVEVLNPWAFGPAWIVDEVLSVATPNEEISALGSIDLRHTAVAEQPFADMLSGANGASESDEIHFVAYKPNELTYATSLSGERVVVFSEIYYPHGWHLYDEQGNELAIARVNYNLRAARIPAGEHRLRMVFDPEAVKKGDRLSLACMAVFLLTLIAALAMAYRGRRKKAGAEA